MDKGNHQMQGTVKAVSKSAAHDFCKPNADSIRLVAGMGVDGDAHMATTPPDPQKPNLRQVSLIQYELYEELRKAGFDLQPGQMAENITTCGIDLMALPRGTRLHIGECAVVELTVLRNPCNLVDKFRPGLKAAVVERDAQGNLVRRAGVLGMILTGGEVHPGDQICIELPPEPQIKLDIVYR